MHKPKWPDDKLDWESFKGKFHSSWHEKMKPFIESEECFNIYQELKNSREVILPASPDVWSAFYLTPYSGIKAIFVGMCPYHTIEGNKPVADGLAFSCGNTRELSPSLITLYDVMEDDLNKKVVREPNLEYLALQGVLLLNTSLTVKHRKADSHKELWEPFVKYLFMNILDTITGVPIILFGDTAKKQVEKYLFPMSQPYLKVTHPAYFSRTGELMIHNNLFTWCNKILMGNNKEVIYWDYNEFSEKWSPF